MQEKKEYKVTQEYLNKQQLGIKLNIQPYSEILYEKQINNKIS